MQTYEECFAHITAGRPFSLTLYAVPLKFRDYDMCLAAVTAEGWTIDAVPANLRDYKMWLAAVTGGLHMSHVPTEFVDYAICKAALVHHSLPIKYIPEDLPGREFLEILANSK
jgi:hypothetical protein